MRVLIILSAVLVSTACTPAARSTGSLSGVVRTDTPPVPGAPAGVTAFVDVAVVPMDREQVLLHQTVLVEKGRITALGPVLHIRIPAGAVRVDGRGRYLIPGLADMHAHLTMGQFGHRQTRRSDSANVETELFLWLANGVTTIRNLDYDSDTAGRQALRFRARAAAGALWSPRIYTAGKWGLRQYLGLEPSDTLRLDRVAAYVAAYKAKGYDVLKVHEEGGNPVLLDSVLAAAHRVGIPVVGHVKEPARVEHVLWGYKSIEHPFFDYLWNKRTKTTNDPVPSDTVGFTALAGELRRAGVWHCPTQGHYDRWHYKDATTMPKLLKIEQDSGVKILLGTDEVPWQGVITRELQAMVAAGLTPYQALQTGTRNVAEYFGTLKESGTIAVGKRADLVLLTGNPLQDVRYTAQPAGVMIGGRWLPRAEMDRHLADLAFPALVPRGETQEQRPAPRYWENVTADAADRIMDLFEALPMDDAQQGHFNQLRAVQQAQRQALDDSLRTSDQYQSGTLRVLQLMATQAGEIRESLTSEQRLLFDWRAGTWIQQRRREGYVVTIPGIQP